jgi:TonB family protein
MRATNCRLTRACGGARASVFAVILMLRRAPADAECSAEHAHLSQCLSKLIRKRVTRDKVIKLLIAAALIGLSILLSAHRLADAKSKASCLDPEAPKPTTVADRGLLNRYASALSQPKYPRAARNAGISGDVDVEVVVDMWSGTVLWARVTSGPIALRDAAASVACRARFSPIVGEGPPTRVGGTLRYTFRCPKVPPN